MAGDTQAVGKTIAGRYRIEELIGQGGMASVYRAHDLLLDRTVAIKHLSIPAAGESSARRRFLDEARSTAALVHPSIVTLYDALEIDGEGYLVIEYVDGPNLRTILKNGPLSPARAISIAGNIAGALEFAHQQGIVHGDIKPENVLIAPDGRPKLLDFGIARRASSIESFTTTRFGTAMYMAPEQLQGGPVSATGDIFSFGLVLFEMVTGRPPTPGAGPASEIERATHESSHFTAEDRTIVSALGRIIARATARNANERYASAGELAMDLRASGRVVESGQPTTIIPRMAPPRPAYPVSARQVGLPFRQFIMPAMTGVLIGSGLIFLIGQSRAADSSVIDPQGAAGTEAVATATSTPSATPTRTPTPTPAPTRTPTPTATPFRLVPIIPFVPTRVAPTPPNREDDRDNRPPWRGNRDRNDDD